MGDPFSAPTVFCLHCIEQGSVGLQSRQISCSYLALGCIAFLQLSALSHGPKLNPNACFKDDIVRTSSYPIDVALRLDITPIDPRGLADGV